MTKFSLYNDHVSVFTLFLARTLIEHPRAQKKFTNYHIQAQLKIRRSHKKECILFIKHNFCENRFSAPLFAHYIAYLL